MRCPFAAIEKSGYPAHAAARQIGIKVIGFSKHTDILEFGALARSAIASPGGKLSSAARLMRNGEMFRFRTWFVKKVQFEKQYVLIYLRTLS